MLQNSIPYLTLCWLLATIFHFGYMVTVKRRNYFLLRDAVDGLLRSAFLGLAVAGLFGIFTTGFGLIRIVVYGGYAPRALDLVIWGLAAYYFFAPGFRLRTVPFVAMTYGFDELVWNALFFVRHPDWVPGSWLQSPSWGMFYVVIVAVFVVGAFLFRPSLRRPGKWITLPIYYFAAYFMIGMPVAIAVIPGQAWNGWNYFWELGWQLSYLSVWKMITA